MAKTQDSDGTSPNQEEFVDETQFLGNEDAEDRAVDNRILIKTITMASIEAQPERAVIAKRRTLLCRVGGIIMGTEQQLRDVAKAGKVSPDTHPEEYGTALVGQFGADVINDDGEILSSYRSGFCYLPGGFQEGELARFAKWRDYDRGMPMSYFFAAEPSGNPRGYRYVAMNAQRVDTFEQDVLQRLRAEAAIVMKGRMSDLPLLSDTRARTIAG